MLRVARHASLQRFWAAADPVLLSDRALNNVILAPAWGSVANPSFGAWTVHDDRDQPVAAVLAAHVFGITLSACARPSSALWSELATALWPVCGSMNQIVGPSEVVEAFLPFWPAPAGAAMHAPTYELTEVQWSPPMQGLRAVFAEPSDLKPLVPLAVDYFVEASAGSGLDDSWATPEVCASMLHNQIRRHQVCMLLGEGGEVLSVVVAELGTADGSTDRDFLLRLSQLYTPPQLRGHGFASRLVAQVSGAALSTWGVDSVVLSTDPTNQTSNRLYQRIGFDYKRDLTLQRLVSSRGVQRA